MWIKFDLEGMEVEFKINGYNRNPDDWANVSFSFKFYDVINYTKNNEELLLCSEVDMFRDKLEKLLNDELTEKEEIEFIEPDFEFVLQPKSDKSHEPSVVYGELGTEIGGIFLDMKINLWSGGLTNNYFSTTFGKDEIEELYIYLLLVTKKITMDDERVVELINKGILYGD